MVTHPWKDIWQLQIFSSLWMSRHIVKKGWLWGEESPWTQTNGNSYTQTLNVWRCITLQHWVVAFVFFHVGTKINKRPFEIQLEIFLKQIQLYKSTIHDDTHQPSMVHLQNLNSSPLELDRWKRILSLRKGNFFGIHVSFRGCPRKLVKA